MKEVPVADLSFSSSFPPTINRQRTPSRDKPLKTNKGKSEENNSNQVKRENTMAGTHFSSKMLKTATNTPSIFTENT